MSRGSEKGNRTTAHHVPPPRWWNSLAFRLGAAVNLTVVVVIALSAWVDHRRDTNTQIQHALTRLQEEAHVLRAAWGQFDNPADFQGFVDAFCRQMTVAASPGHHIAIFDADGTVIIRAHERAAPALERLMDDRPTGEPRTFDYNGERFASVWLDIQDGEGLAVAVSLAPVEEVLRAQGISRAATTGILVVIIFGVTAACLLVWVRNPLHGFVRAVSAASERRFDQRVEPQGAAELRYLAEGINEMVHALDRTERQRSSELQRAREIQRALVGERNLVVNGCLIQSVFLPAASVGGDFFDIVPTRDGSTLIFVLDVTGHGIPGALCTALLRSSLRHLARATSDLGEITRGLNHELCDIAAADVFATAVLLKIKPECGRFSYVVAGHDPPVLVEPDGRSARLEHGGMMLGVDPGACYSAAEFELSPGGRIFLFTDGLHEAMSPSGEQFGRNRVSKLFTRTSHLAIEKQLSVALDDVRSFQEREEFQDDVTVLAICRGDAKANDRPAGSNVAICGSSAILGRLVVD